MNYRSFADLNNAIVKNLQKFPHDVDLIVGVPRSGMIPAYLLSLYLNKPYTDIDSFIEGRIISCGEREALISTSKSNKILIIDDSVNLGHAIKNTKEKLKVIESQYSFVFCAVYGVESSIGLVDVICEVVEYPRVFQWNIFHHPTIIPNSCFDIDGVLCEDPPLDDDGPIYEEYLKNAIPKYLPSVEIDTLVTCRLEKYRKITEEWLSKNHIRYKKLIMLDFKSRQERISWGKHGEYKGNVYKVSPCVLFVESSLKQALEIAEISDKCVFCTETFEMIEIRSVRKKTTNLLHSFHVVLWKIKCNILHWVKWGKL